MVNRSGPDPERGYGCREGRSTSLRGGRRQPAATSIARTRQPAATSIAHTRQPAATSITRTRPAARARIKRSPKLGTKRVSCNRLIPLSGLPLPRGATRSAHAPAQSAAVRTVGHGHRDPAPPPRGGPGPRPRRRLSLRDAGLRFLVRTRLRPRTGLRTRSGAADRSRPWPHRGGPGAPGARARRGAAGGPRVLDRLSGRPPAAPGAAPAGRPAAPDAVGQAHRPRLLAAGDADAAGVRVRGPAAPRRRTRPVRRLLPAGERRRGVLGAAVRPDLRAGHAADRVHARRAADPPRRGRVRRAGDGRLHGPRAGCRLALRRHPALCADRDRPPVADHRAASGQPTGDSTAGRAGGAAGRPVVAAAAGEPSAPGGSPARAAYAAIAAPTIPALF